MKMDLAAPKNEEPEIKRHLTESLLSIEGLEPGMELTAAETVFLEDLILKNLQRR